VLSGLINGVLLIFISFHIMCESIERIYEPVVIIEEGLLTVSTIGFFVNLIGLFLFHDFHHHGEEECSHGHHHKHESEQDEIISHEEEEPLDSTSTAKKRKQKKKKGKQTDLE